MDKLCWRSCNGRCYSRRRHVPAVASNPTLGRVVPLHGLLGSHWVATRHLCDKIDLLHHHRPRCKSRYMDISPVVCRCRIRMFTFEPDCQWNLTEIPVFRSILSSLSVSGTYRKRSRRRRNLERNRRKGRGCSNTSRAYSGSSFRLTDGNSLQPQCRLRIESVQTARSPSRLNKARANSLAPIRTSSGRLACSGGLFKKERGWWR